MKNSLKTVCGNLFDNTETIFVFITSFYSPIHIFQKIVSLCRVNPQVKRKKNFWNLIDPFDLLVALFGAIKIHNGNKVFMTNL